ncbi:DUF1738 domain-containing protein [Ensifer sp. IC4062]|nr:DUF1738 domain-containing protein [Ensifer sp. IC4062]
MWMTFKHALELGAAVRKGETGASSQAASLRPRRTATAARSNGKSRSSRRTPFSRRADRRTSRPLSPPPGSCARSGRPGRACRSLLPQHRRADPPWRKPGLLRARSRPDSDATV